MVRDVTAWFLEVRAGGTCRAMMTSGGPRGTSTLVPPSGGSTSAVTATPWGFALRRQRRGDVYFDDDGPGLARGATFSAIH